MMKILHSEKNTPEVITIKISLQHALIVGLQRESQGCQNTPTQITRTHLPDNSVQKQRV